MPKVRFTADFDFKPSPQVTLAYLAGQECLVTTACAEAAIARGRAEPIDTPIAGAGVAGTIARTPRKRTSGKHGPRQ